MISFFNKRKVGGDILSDDEENKWYTDAGSDYSGSNYSWNSDDEPPWEGEGDEYICTYDKLVLRKVLQPGQGDERPGSYDKVLLDYNNDIKWYNLGGNELPC